MGKKFDKLIVVDVEATCWEGKQSENKENEIIEIGLCLLDLLNHEISNNRGIIVKPENSEVSEFCTKLTTLTQEIVNNGISLKEACEILEKEYESKSRIWASYGAYDLNQFSKECLKKKINYPFSSNHINVKTLFCLKNRLKREVGMSGALKILNLEIEGTHHRGVDDSKNIAKILKKLIE
jgi:inhibitor of KinA sporulation pathway (predicted exonuclease)